MARANIVLKGANSHRRANGKVMLKNRAEVFNDAASINYYKTQSGFVVTDLEDAPKPKAKRQKPKVEDKPKTGLFGRGKKPAKGSDEPAL